MQLSSMSPESMMFSWQLVVIALVWAMMCIVGAHECTVSTSLDPLTLVQLSEVSRLTLVTVTLRALVAVMLLKKNRGLGFCEQHALEWDLGELALMSDVNALA